MRSLLYVLTGCSLLLLAPLIGLSQPPAGGFDRQRGGGGGRGGMGGMGGFNFDPNEIFNRMSNGKEDWTRADSPNPQIFDRTAERIGGANGQITREQYVN